MAKKAVLFCLQKFLFYYVCSFVYSASALLREALEEDFQIDAEPVTML